MIHTAGQGYNSRYLVSICRCVLQNSSFPVYPVHEPFSNGRVDTIKISSLFSVSCQDSCYPHVKVVFFYTLLAQSLVLSIHLFCCLPLLQIPFTRQCKALDSKLLSFILATCPNQFRIRFFIIFTVVSFLLQLFSHDFIS